jgi:hypothetical protein
MKVYITTWALTRGIIEAEAAVGNDRSGVVFLEDGKMFLDSEYKTTWEEAVEEFERMKDERLGQLAAQAERLGRREPKLVKPKKRRVEPCPRS